MKTIDLDYDEVKHLIKFLKQHRNSGGITADEYTLNEWILEKLDDNYEPED